MSVSLRVRADRMAVSCGSLYDNGGALLPDQALRWRSHFRRREAVALINGDYDIVFVAQGVEESHGCDGEG